MYDVVNVRLRYALEARAETRTPNSAIVPTATFIIPPFHDRLANTSSPSQCDRSRPCHACIIRGLEAECTYLATAEDHAQINQAEIIDRLRREVAQLRGQLSQGPAPRQGPSPGSIRRRHDYARKYGGGGGGGGASNGDSRRRNGYAGNRVAQRQTNTAGSVNGVENEGSWAGSSPSSTTTTMTNSNSVTMTMTMTSPDSTGTGSENGSTMFSYPAPAPYGAVVEAEGAGAFNELGCSTSESSSQLHNKKPSL